MKKQSRITFFFVALFIITALMNVSFASTNNTDPLVLDRYNMTIIDRVGDSPDADASGNGSCVIKVLSGKAKSISSADKHIATGAINNYGSRIFIYPVSDGETNIEVTGEDDTVAIVHVSVDYSFEFNVSELVIDSTYKSYKKHPGYILSTYRNDEEDVEEYKSKYSINSSSLIFKVTSEDPSIVRLKISRRDYDGDEYSVFADQEEDDGFRYFYERDAYYDEDYITDVEICEIMPKMLEQLTSFLRADMGKL